MILQEIMTKFIVLLNETKYKKGNISKILAIFFHIKTWRSHLLTDLEKIQNSWLYFYWIIFFAEYKLNWPVCIYMHVYTGVLSKTNIFLHPSSKIYANKTKSKHRPFHFIYILLYSQHFQINSDFSFENTYQKKNFLNQNYVFEKWVLIFVLYYPSFPFPFFLRNIRWKSNRRKLFVILCTLVIYFQFKLIYLFKNELGLRNRILKESRNNIVFEKWRFGK